MTALRITETEGALVVRAGDVEIARYVLRPDAPASEAPKPYLHPLRTLGGAIVTGYRPWDHRWHKGLQMTWSHVSGQNFWGGPTFAPETGYAWQDNLGRIEHEGFTAEHDEGADARFRERLGWVTSRGERWLDEQREHRFHHADPFRGLWALDVATTLRNVRGSELRLGSPTTAGRENAGYTGWFWRAPRSWTGCAVHSALGLGTEAGTGEAGADDPSRGVDAVMGTEQPWVALVSEHDDIDGAATLLALAGTSSAPGPIRWFVRSQPFPVLAPSPAFAEEIVLAPEEELHLRHRFVVVDEGLDAAGIRALAEEFAL